MSEETNEKPKVLTDKQVAEILNVSERTVKRYRAQGKLKYCQVTAKQRMTKPEHIDEYLKNCEAA